MTSNKSRLIRVAIGTIALSIYAGTASGDVLALKCAASAKRCEAKLLLCTARCAERYERGQDVSCRGRCEAHYDSEIAARGCDGDTVSAAAVHSSALVREARAEFTQARLLKCTARCEDSASPEACLVLCERRYLGLSE